MKKRFDRIIIVVQPIVSECMLRFDYIFADINVIWDDTFLSILTISNIYIMHSEILGIACTQRLLASKICGKTNIH